MTLSPWGGLSLEEFRTGARRWLANATEGAPPDYGAIVPATEIDSAVAWQHRLADAGLAGLHWPTRWGGQGLTPEHTGVWLEECAWARVPPFLNMVGLVLAAEGLLCFGTEEQQAQHLPPLRRGDRVWCQLFSEPDAGSDLAHLSTRAERRNGGWLLNGQKLWCSNGGLADWGICLARSDPGAPAHRGLSFFLVDMRSPGIELRPLRQITGRSDFDEVFLSDVFLPASALLGEVGAGWTVAMATLTNERNHIGASAIGLGHRLDRLLAGAAGGTRVWRERTMVLWCRGRAVIELAGQPRLGAAAASLMKLAVAELAFDVANFEADLAGAAGLLDGDVAAQLVGATAARIAGGTTQVQKNIISERILGLPRDPPVN